MGLDTELIGPFSRKCTPFFTGDNNVLPTDSSMENTIRTLSCSIKHTHAPRLQYLCVRKVITTEAEYTSRVLQQLLQYIAINFVPNFASIRQLVVDPITDESPVI